MEDELAAITNGALINRAADETNPYEFRLRAGRKAVQEYANAGDSKKLESVCCDVRLPREVRVEAGQELVKYSSTQGKDIMLWHLRGSPLEEVAKAAAEAIKAIASGKRLGEHPVVAAGRDKAVARN